MTIIAMAEAISARPGWIGTRNSQLIKAMEATKMPE